VLLLYRVVARHDSYHASTPIVWDVHVVHVLYDRCPTILVFLYCCCLVYTKMFTVHYNVERNSERNDYGAALEVLLVGIHRHVLQP